MTAACWSAAARTLWRAHGSCRTFWTPRTGATAAASCRGRPPYTHGAKMLCTKVILRCSLKRTAGVFWPDVHESVSQNGYEAECEVYPKPSCPYCPCMPVTTGHCVGAGTQVRAHAANHSAQDWHGRESYRCHSLAGPLLQAVEPCTRSVLFLHHACVSPCMHRHSLTSVVPAHLGFTRTSHCCFACLSRTGSAR